MVDPQTLAAIVVNLVRPSLAKLETEHAVLTERVAQLTAQLTKATDESMLVRERLAAAEGRPPTPGPCGPAGADGWSPDEITIAQDPDDDRVLTFSFRGGETVKKSVVRICTPRFCGKWKSERAYLPGDEVLLDGFWRCDAPTRARPGGPGDGWTLIVKGGDLR